MTFWKRQNCRNRSQIFGCYGLGIGEGLTTEGPGEFLELMELLCVLFVVVVVTRLDMFA